MILIMRPLVIDLASVRLISDRSLGTMGGEVDSHLNKAPGEGNKPNGMSSSPAEEGEEADTNNSDREEEPVSGKEPIAKMSTYMKTSTHDNAL